MNPLLVLGIQSALSFIAFALIAKWYVLPMMSELTLEQRLIPLTWLHVFRYVALVGLLPGQVSAEVPPDPLAAVVYGDMLSGLLALVVVVMLRYRTPGAIGAAWIFNIVGLADWAQSQVQGMSAGIFQYALGASALVFVFYVPLLVVSHVVMIYWLATRLRGNAG
ncbi:MAG TPA: hypothetical protein VGL25_01380 [Casimicrobiaceae bacterium]|jgi:hypothetical protein